MPPRRLLTIYVAAVILGGTALTLWCLTDTDAEMVRRAPVAGALFAVLFLAAELFPIRVYSRKDAGSFTTSAAFGYALILSVPLPLALLAIPIGSVAGDLRNQRPPMRTAFNAAQMMMSFALGAIVLRGLLGATYFGPEEAIGLPLVLALIPSGAAMYVSNIVMIGVAISIDGDVPLRTVLAEDFAPIDVIAHFMLLGLAPIFVVVTQRNVLLAPLLFLTVAAVYRSTQAALQRQHEAMHDQLTGLPNRRHFDARLDELTDLARRTDQPVGVLLLDLDRFKEVNDTLGHHIGDALLIAVGDRLLDLPDVDTVARLGGDEFALLVAGREAVSSVTDVAAAVVARLGERFLIEDFPLHIGGSVGIATFPVHGRESDQLTRRADAAMYQAKRGSTGYAFADADAQSIGPGRVALLGDLPAAIDEGQIRLDYQPKTDVLTGAVTGFEALIRWDHPVLGSLDPGVFIPMVEHTDLIGPLTSYVLTEALAACGSWKRAGHDVRVAVNISARDLQDQRFPQRVRDCLDQSGVEARNLELEITENAIMADHGRASMVLDQLRSLGVTLTIDDFGTGYSSLGHLRALPIDVIKIDRAFVAGLTSSPADAVIVHSVIRLAHGLGMTVVAEGVEQALTLRRLVEQGCNEAQGYLISPPMPARQVLLWIRDFEPVRVTSLAPQGIEVVA